MTHPFTSLCTIPGYPGYYLHNTQIPENGFPSVWSSRGRLGSLKQLKLFNYKKKPSVTLTNKQGKQQTVALPQIIKISSRGKRGTWTNQRFVEDK